MKLHGALNVLPQTLTNKRTGHRYWLYQSTIRCPRHSLQGAAKPQAARAHRSTTAAAWHTCSTLDACTV